jgi:hypothetical protein
VITAGQLVVGDGRLDRGEERASRNEWMGEAALSVRTTEAPEPINTNNKQPMSSDPLAAASGRKSNGSLIFLNNASGGPSPKGVARTALSTFSIAGWLHNPSFLFKQH